MTETGQAGEHRDFFISRAGADAAIAGTIGKILEDAGHPVLLQQWDFGHKNFMGEMHDALTSNARVIALLSPQYLESQHCLAEALNAIGHDPLNKKNRLIVMRVSECTPNGLFTALTYCDLLPVRDDMRVLGDIVRDAVKPGRRKDVSTAKYWHEPNLVLHTAIKEIPNFTGRVDDLGKVEAVLWAETPAGDAPAHVAAITQTAVHGLGGIGKSVLATEYGWENRERYAGVWSFAAETPTGIEDGLIELGARFIPGLDTVENRAAAAQETLKFIAGAGFDKPWLLIYDNIEKPEALDGLTPRSGAHLLISTRWPRWQGRAEALELGKFTEDEAVDFFLKATGRADREGAARLSQALDYLPLALDHAAAFCADSGDSFDAYAARMADWIREAPEGADYPQAVFATFSLAIEKAAASVPEAEKLMGLLAFMAPDDFPRDIIPEEVIGGHALSKATAELRKVSLIAVKEQAESGPLLSAHRLVQHVMRARLAEQGVADATAVAALMILADAFPANDPPPDDVRSWPRCQRLEKHVETIFGFAPDKGEESKKTSLLLIHYGIYLQSCTAS